MPPTLKYLTGFEHGVASGSGGGLGGIGGRVTVVTSPVKDGTYAVQIDPTGANNAQWAFPSLASGTALWVIGFDFYPITMPAGSAAAKILGMASGGGTTIRPSIHYNNATGKLMIGVADNGSGGGRADFVDFGPVLSMNTWYHIDIKIDVSANPWTITAEVNGQDEATTTSAQAATTYVTGSLGTASTTGPSYTFVADNVVVSNTLADYPLGPSFRVLGFSPNADGTHNAGTNVMEDNAGADIGVVTAWNLLDDVPLTAGGTSADYVKQVAIGTGNYAEVKFASLAAGIPVDVVGLLLYSSGGSPVNQGATIARDNSGTETTIWGNPTTRADYSDAEFYKSAIITRPGSGWTLTELANLRMRIGFSGDVTPNPWWKALMFEVAFQDEMPPTLDELPVIDDKYDDDYFDCCCGWQQSPMPADVAASEPDMVSVEPPTIDAQELLSDTSAYYEWFSMALPDDVVVVADQISDEFPVIDETYDEEYDYLGLQEWLTPDDVTEPPVEPVFPVIDELYDEEHDYTGWLFSIVPPDIEELFSSVAEQFPQVDETYDEEHNYDGFLLAPLADSVVEPYVLPELAVIDDYYDATNEHDFSGWQEYLTPEDVMDFQPLAEYPAMDETYDEFIDHNFDGFWLAPLSDDLNEYIDKEFPVIDETYDRDNQWRGWVLAPLAPDPLQPNIIEFPVVDEAYDHEYTYEGFQFFITPEDVMDFMPLPEMPVMDESYDEEHNYDGWVLAPLSPDFIDYTWPEATQIDETYDEEHNYDGYAAWQMPSDVVDFQALPENTQIDETYDHEYDYSGWQFFVTPEDVQGFQPLPETTPIDDLVYAEEHDYAGWQKSPIASDADIPLIGLELPVIDELYDEVYDYTGFQMFQTPLDVLPRHHHVLLGDNNFYVRFQKDISADVTLGEAEFYTKFQQAVTGQTRFNRSQSGNIKLEESDTP